MTPSLLATDVLLCHDDELEGRRIAFILYLVPAWEQADGGTLDLYDADGEKPESTPRLWAACSLVAKLHDWDQGDLGALVLPNSKS